MFFGALFGTESHKALRDTRVVWEKKAREAAGLSVAAAQLRKEGFVCQFKFCFMLKLWELFSVHLY